MSACCANFVRSGIPHIEVPVEDLAGGPMECRAVTVLLSSCYVAVASTYIRPARTWDTSSLLLLFAQLGQVFLVFGIFSGPSILWG